MKNLILIADYCSDTLAVQEIRSALLGHLSTSIISTFSVVNSTPHTVHTAFLIKQIMQTEARLGDLNNLVIFVNTDPRIQTNQGVELAKGAEFIIIKMNNGAWACGPNAGFNFSLVKNQIEFIYLYPGFDKGTQFRSRDLYSRVAALLMEGKQEEMELEEVRNNIIPKLDDYYIGHIDNYGNMKTTIPHFFMKGKHELGEKIKVTIGKSTKTAYYVNNMFAKEPGTLIVAPGSSGPLDDPFLEVIVWEHFPTQSARREFPQARPGDLITLE